MVKPDSRLIKKELSLKFPKYKWFVRERSGGMSWSFIVESVPKVSDDDYDGMRAILSRFERIDRDEATGEILGALWNQTI